MPSITPVLSLASSSAFLVVPISVVDSIAVVCVVAALLPPVVSFVVFLLLPHADRHITVIMTSTANTYGFILFIIHSPFIFYA